MLMSRGGCFTMLGCIASRILCSTSAWHQHNCLVPAAVIVYGCFSAYLTARQILGTIYHQDQRGIIHIMWWHRLEQAGQ